MSDTTVKYYASTMSGASALSGAAGKLLDVLNACLVDGFGSVTLTGLVVADNVATATVSGGHNFAMVGGTGPVITIAGATPSGLNGEWRITVTNSTVFTFATTGITNQTATGTITAKRSPAGFSKAYTGTNKVAYRADAIDSTRLYLRVLDDSTKWATLTLRESMTDIDTGTGGFTYYLYKSDTENSTERTWTLIANDKIIYLIVNNGSSYNSGLCFGDIIKYSSSDAYACIMISNPGNSSISDNSMLVLINSQTGHGIARSYNQITKALTFSCHSHTKTNTYFGYTGAQYPNQADQGFHIWPIQCWENDTIIRGMLPGVFNPLHAYTGLTDNLIISSDKDYLVKSLLSGMLAFDLTGPWGE